MAFMLNLGSREMFQDRDFLRRRRSSRRTEFEEGFLVLKLKV